MGVMLLGWLLISLGIISLISGICGAIMTMFQDLRRRADGRQSFALNLLPMQFMQVLTEFIRVLIRAPAWLVLLLAGMALIGWGGTLIDGTW